GPDPAPQFVARGFSCARKLQTRRRPATRPAQQSIPSHASYIFFTFRVCGLFSSIIQPTFRARHGHARPALENAFCSWPRQEEPMNTLPIYNGHRPMVSSSQLLKRGERLLEPDVYRTELAGRAAVVKDYRRYRGTPLSPLARLLVRREARVLRRLSGWKHAPALLGTVGGLALGMEFVPGHTLSAGAQELSQEVFDQLQGALARLHAAGITHNDLHGTN